MPANLRQVGAMHLTGLDIQAMGAGRLDASLVQATSSTEIDLAKTHQLVPAMGGFDDPDGSRLRAHDHAGCACAATEILHPFEVITVGDTGSGEEDVIAAY